MQVVNQVGRKRHRLPRPGVPRGVYESNRPFNQGGYLIRHGFRGRDSRLTFLCLPFPAFPIPSLAVLIPLIGVPYRAGFQGHRLYS